MLVKVTILELIVVTRGMVLLIPLKFVAVTMFEVVPAVVGVPVRYQGEPPARDRPSGRSPE